MKPSRILLFAAILLAQFAAFEAGLRLWAGSEAAPVFQQLFTTDPASGDYELRPGASAHFKTSEFETDIAINSSGVRDREIGTKAPDERRIVVLGDSLVLAVQVEAAETFCANLEKRLNARREPGRPRYRVINAGVQGYGPIEEMRFFERAVRRFQPDIVVVSLYVANDAMEAANRADLVLPADANVSPAASSAAISNAVQRPSRYPLWLRRLTRRSMVTQILRLRVNALTERIGQARPIDRALTIYLPNLTPDMARGLAATREAVRRIGSVAAEQGAATIVMLIPARFQIDDEDYGNLRAVVADAGQPLVRDLASERFTEALAPLGLPTWNALPALRGSSERKRLFFRGTAHFTVTGHEVLAEGLERFLRDAHLVGSADAPSVVPATAGAVR